MIAANFTAVEGRTCWCGGEESEEVEERFVQLSVSPASFSCHCGVCYAEVKEAEII